MNIVINVTPEQLSTLLVALEEWIEACNNSIKWAGEADKLNDEEQMDLEDAMVERSRATELWSQLKPLQVK